MLILIDKLAGSQAKLCCADFSLKAGGALLHIYRQAGSTGQFW